MVQKIPKSNQKDKIRSIIFFIGLATVVLTTIGIGIYDLSRIVRELQIHRYTFQESVGNIIFWIIFIIISLTVIILMFNFFKKKKYALAFGGLIGSLLAIANALIFLGLLGFFFLIPFPSFCPIGEKGWGCMIEVGSVGFLITGFLIGWILEKIISLKKTYLILFYKIISPNPHTLHYPTISQPSPRKPTPP